MHWFIDLQHYLYLKRVTLEEMSHGGHFWSFCGHNEHMVDILWTEVNMFGVCHWSYND